MSSLSLGLIRYSLKVHPRNRQNFQAILNPRFSSSHCFIFTSTTSIGTRKWSSQRRINLLELQLRAMRVAQESRRLVIRFRKQNLRRLLTSFVPSSVQRREVCLSSVLFLIRAMNSNQSLFSAIKTSM